MKISILLSTFLFFSFQLWSQNMFDFEYSENIIIDVEEEVNLSKKDTNRVLFRMYSFVSNKKEERDSLYGCIPSFNTRNIDLKVTKYIGKSTQFYLQTKDEKVINHYSRSTLIIFTSNKKIQQALDKNKNYLSLNKGIKNYQTTEGIYEIDDIKSQDDFCWKLNLIIHFFESNKELFNKEEKPVLPGDENKPKFSINLGFSILNPQKIATTQGFYSNQLSAAAMPLSYAADFQYWINNFRVGLGYAYSNYQFNNSLADNNYSIDWKSDKLSNASQMNIYASNLRESFSFVQHNLNLLAGYSINLPVFKEEKKKNKLRLDIDLGLGYVLPFNLRSQLTDANISYRGMVNGIEDELMNIAELGLIENDRTAIGKETALRMQGISLHTGLNLVYAYNNFNFKLGMGYHLNRYSNKSYNENQRLSNFSGDYQSSLYSNKQLSSQFNSFQFSIGYTIK